MMSEVVLGGRTWRVPPLSPKVAERIKPALAVFVEGADASRYSEADLWTIGDAIWRAVSSADPNMTHQDFVDLPFSVADMLRVFPRVAAAARAAARPVAHGDHPDFAAVNAAFDP